MQPKRADISEEKKRLIEGNHRFIQTHGHDLARHVSGQKPYAVILTCSDSRVPPEHIFNAGVGELFVVRDAGNIAFGSSVIGSLEYAVSHLHVPLLLILGHTNCGAMKASETGPGDGTCIGDIVNEIRCCFGGDDHLRDNVRRQEKMILQRSPAIAQAVESGALEIQGAIYHLEDGTVEFL
ncbi:MAG: carbonic anhydrase [Thermoplasmata archaeon]|nr:carbonic anhydrase [Thermoplasmata archaeon]